MGSPAIAIPVDIDRPDPFQELFVCLSVEIAQTINTPSSQAHTPAPHLADHQHPLPAAESNEYAHA